MVKDVHGSLSDHHQHHQTEQGHQPDQVEDDTYIICQFVSPSRAEQRQLHNYPNVCRVSRDSCCNHKRLALPPILPSSPRRVPTESPLNNTAYYILCYYITIRISFPTWAALQLNRTSTSWRWGEERAANGNGRRMGGGMGREAELKRHYESHLSWASGTTAIIIQHPLT